MDMASTVSALYSYHMDRVGTVLAEVGKRNFF
jgi:hypothetical protein